jgi:hypothetical protein
MFAVFLKYHCTHCIHESTTGWFHGDVQLVDKITKEVTFRGPTDPIAKSSEIGKEWSHPWGLRTDEFKRNTSAESISVIASECVYREFVKDYGCEKYKTIAVTSMGNTDIATHGFVYLLSMRTGLPVYVFVDYDPHGINIMKRFYYGCKNGVDTVEKRRRYRIPGLRWAAVREPQIKHLSESTSFEGVQLHKFPSSVYQNFTDEEKAQMPGILKSKFASHTPARHRALLKMDVEGKTISLDALNDQGNGLAALFIGKVLEHNIYLCRS